MTPGEEVRSGEKVSFFLFSLQVICIKCTLRCRSLEQSSQPNWLSRAPAPADQFSQWGQMPMPRRLPAEADNRLISFGSAGVFSCFFSNKQAGLHTSKSGLSLQFCVEGFFFSICIIISGPKVCFKPALVDFTRVAGFSALIIFHKR